MFVITGVTGQVGGIVAARLLEAGVPIRAVARNAEKAAEWKDKGADLALAEMTDADALTKAFAGADGVFLLIPPTFDPTPALRKCARSLRRWRPRFFLLIPPRSFASRPSARRPENLTS